MNTTVLSAFVALGISGTAVAGLPVEVVTFDDLPIGPSTYAAAGPAQTLSYSSDQIVFNGGVVLGFPTSFPAVDFASAPNVYASSNIGDNSLSDTMTIDIDGLGVNRVEGLIFNGETIANDLLVEAYDSFGALLDSQVYSVASNLESGAAVFSMNSDMPNIARVEFSEFNTDGSWNILLDSIVFNREIPAPGALLPIGTLGLLAARRRRA